MITSVWSRNKRDAGAALAEVQQDSRASPVSAATAVISEIEKGGHVVIYQ